MEQEFLKEIVSRLEQQGVTYAITGSVGSNYWGTPRTTHDVDVVIVLSAADVKRIVAAFSDRFYVSEPAVRDAVLRGSMFNLIDFGSSLKADMWVTAGDEFNQSMLSRRQRVEIVAGQQAYVSSAEDILLHKLVWNQITPSDRQLTDAAGIAAVQAGHLDLDYLRTWANRQRTSEVLEDVLQGKYLKRT